MVDEDGNVLAPGDLVTLQGRVERVSESLSSNDVMLTIRTYPDPVQYSEGLLVVCDGTAVKKIAT